MGKENIIFGLGGILLGVLIAPMFFGGWGMGGMMSGFYRGSNTSMMGNIDQHFIEQMIPHHEGAITMAKLALEKSKRPEILSLANGIIEAQTREINNMKSWYEDWFGSDVPNYSSSMMGHGGMMMPMTGFVGNSTTLENAKDFDLEFINQMIPHHEMAIMMARMLAATSNRKEMKELADQIIISQSGEIDMMRSWYATWSK
ncbi:MAG: DUF305 domain-containing protein [Patescibacteria group bacterium]